MSCFDFDSADYLEDMVGIYKISSSDLTNIPFIKHIAKKGKPIYISTGAAYISEIEELLVAFIEVNFIGAKKVIGQVMKLA